MIKQSFGKLIKFQLSSLIATLIDFSCTILLKEVGGVGYLLSTATGSLIGGVANFVIGRRWVFHAAELAPGSQAIRYLLVWGGSILLNISGVFLLTSIGRMNYLFSKIFSAVMVGFFFNYILQNKYVFSINHEIQDSQNS